MTEKTRLHFTEVIILAISDEMKTKEDTIKCIEALLLVAAATTNAISTFTVGFSAAHVEECATEMKSLLGKAFGLEGGKL